MTTKKILWCSAWALGGERHRWRQPGRVLMPLAASLRYDSNSGGEREIQRTMLELLNQLDGFDSRGDVKVIMATNRIETLDPALIRPGQAAWAPSWGVNALPWFCVSKGRFGEDGLTGDMYKGKYCLEAWSNLPNCVPLR